jgi:hypothetical protein
MLRIAGLVVLLLGLAAPPVAGQGQEARVRGWDPIVLDLSGDEATATVSGRLLSHEAAHTVQQGRAQGPTPLAGSIRTSVSSMTYQGGSSIEVKSGGGGGGSGPPLARASVVLEGIEGGPRQTTSTDGSGRFAFQNVAPGGYQLSWDDRGQRRYQQVWIEELSNLRENGLEAACRRKCAAEHTNPQGALNLDGYGACMRECRSGAAICPAPDGDTSR